MAVGCAAGFAKLVLFVFNAIFWLCGLALLILGIVFLVAPNTVTVQQVLSESDHSMKVGAWFCVVLGVAIFIIGFSGCCGAIQESSVLLGIYITLLTILLIAEITLAIVMGVKMKNITEDVMSQGWRSFTEDKYKFFASKPSGAETQRANEIVDKVQKSLQCCGFNGSTDWESTKFYKEAQNSGFKFPPSCCTEVDDMRGYASSPQYQTCNQDATKRYTKPCNGEIEAEIRAKYPIIVAVVAVVAAIEFVGIFLALCLCLSVKREQAY